MVFQVQTTGPGRTSRNFNDCGNLARAFSIVKGGSRCPFRLLGRAAASNSFHEKAGVSQVSFCSSFASQLESVVSRRSEEVTVSADVACCQGNANRLECFVCWIQRIPHEFVNEAVAPVEVVANTRANSPRKTYVVAHRSQGNAQRYP